MKENREGKRKKERERRITLLPTFGLYRDERTEGRLEINIIKFAVRCVTIAQSFFYSFSHHFVNFLFCFLFYKHQQQQQQQLTKRFACSVRNTRIRRDFLLVLVSLIRCRYLSRSHSVIRVTNNIL
jgi:hypothetical protein